MRKATTPDSTLVLWDIDGTLLASAAFNSVYYLDAIRAIHPEFDSIPENTDGMTDRQIIEAHLAAVSLPREEAAVILDRLDDLSQSYLEEPNRLTMLPGVNDALARVAQAGFTNGLLTGNTPTRASHKLRGAGVAVDLISWEQSFFGAEASRREELTHRARERYPERPMVIIGDTPRDGQAAAAAGITFVGVTTGSFGAEALQEAGAVNVIPDLVTGIDGLVAWLQARVR
ncbi:MAG: HAD family hydrolase [Ancrocorticia sp.]|uniref:HAD family hydrolase n=1 Tax=Ancrocorticia sp. TaxID=2593684 RepID=UPI003F8DF3B2